MAIEVRKFAITVLTGSTPGNPQISSLKMVARQVDEVEVRVPPGPRGEVGFALGLSGVAVIPIQIGQYIVTDNEVISWKLEQYPESGDWQLFAYNTGTFNHTLEVRFLLNAPQLVGPQQVQPIPASQLGSAVGGIPAAPPLPDAPPISLPPPPGEQVPALPAPPILSTFPGEVASQVFQTVTPLTPIDIGKFFAGSG